MLVPKGTISDANRIILIESLASMLVIVMLTNVAIRGVAWWYRASNTHARYLPEWAFSGRSSLWCAPSPR